MIGLPFQLDPDILHCPSNQWLPSESLPCMTVFVSYITQNLFKCLKLHL